MSSASGYSVVPGQRMFLPCRIIQMILAIIILGLAAYHYSRVYNYDAGVISIFTALATIIFLIYWFVANSPANTNLYNYWAIFAVELFVLIFWLCAFALTADKVATLVQCYSYDTSYDSSDYTSDGSGYSSDSSSYILAIHPTAVALVALTATLASVSYKRDLSYKRDMVKRSTDPFYTTSYVALALSVINFVLFAVTFTLYTIKMFRHHAAQSSAPNNNFAITNGQGAPSQMEKGTTVNQHQ